MSLKIWIRRVKIQLKCNEEFKQKLEPPVSCYTSSVFSPSE